MRFEENDIDPVPFCEVQADHSLHRVVGVLRPRDSDKLEYPSFERPCFTTRFTTDRMQAIERRGRQ